MKHLSFVFLFTLFSLQTNAQQSTKLKEINLYDKANLQFNNFFYVEALKNYSSFLKINEKTFQNSTDSTTLSILPELNQKIEKCSKALNLYQLVFNSLLECPCKDLESFVEDDFDSNLINCPCLSKVDVFDEIDMDVDSITLDLVLYEDESISCSPIYAGASFTINFDSSSSDLNLMDSITIDLAIELLNANNFQIEISGHTDNIENSKSLSEKRVKSIYNYLITNKLDTNRVMINQKGYSKEYPCTNNDTEENRALNRRVVIVILGEDVESYLDIYSENNCFE